MKLGVAILVAFSVSSCDGAHILALFPVGSKSHKLAVMPIIEVNRIVLALFKDDFFTACLLYFDTGIG